jgi:hypothetical protein
MKRRINLLQSGTLRFRSGVTGRTEPKIAGGEHYRYSAEFCDFMNTIDPRVPCENGCAWISPFGWVPNAGCPRHD